MVSFGCLGAVCDLKKINEYINFYVHRSLRLSLVYLHSRQEDYTEDERLMGSNR